MPRICTFDYPRLTKNTTGSVESSWVRSFQVDESWLMKIRCSKRALPPQIRSTLNNTAAPPQFYAGVSNSRDHSWPTLLNKVEQTTSAFRMTRSVESQKVRAAADLYLTTTGSALHEGSVPALLRSKILVHLVFHANEQCAQRTWESQRSLYKYGLVLFHDTGGEESCDRTVTLWIISPACIAGARPQQTFALFRNSTTEHRKYLMHYCAVWGTNRGTKEPKQGSVLDDRTKEFVAVMTGRASHARQHAFHEAADLMVNMVQLVSRGLPRLPMSLFAEEVSCPGPTREGEEEEKEEDLYIQKGTGWPCSIALFY